MPRQEGWTCQIRARVAAHVSSLKRKCWPETNFFEFWAFRCRPCSNEPVSHVIFLESLTCRHEAGHLWRVSRLSHIILKNPKQGYLGKFTWPKTKFFEFWAFCCRPCSNEPVSPVIFFFWFIDVQTWHKPPLESLRRSPDNFKKNPEQGYLGKFTWPKTKFFEF